MSDRAIREKFYELDIPKIYHKSRLSDFNTKPNDCRKNLFITGKTGVGKTSYMVALLAEDIRRRTEGGYMLPDYVYKSVPELLFDIRATYESGNKDSEHKIIKTCQKAEFLFLDDIGVEKVSDWVMQIFYLIINYRYGEELPICVTSNFSLGQLAVKTNTRISSRLNQMCQIVKLSGKDLRVE